jgi:UDP-glucose 4-epimerase
MADKRVLITGGAGFIGSHLAERLLADGHQVHVIDDLSTGSLDNIAHLQSNSRFTCTVETILNLRVMEELVQDCDMVFHLAAAVGVEYVLRNQLKAIEVNVQGTEIVLRNASKSTKKVVLFSTSEIYGKGDTVPFSEDDDSTLGPTRVTRWSYAVTKALDEIMGLAYWREEGLPVVIVRCFNICGPRQTGRYGMVLPRFVKQALAGDPITVFGEGTQTRCFASVYDVVDGVVRLVGSDRAVGEIFNIGSDREISIGELAARVKHLCASPSTIEYIPYDEAYGPGFEDMKRRLPDLSKIRSCIGYEPQVDLDQIIKSVIGYFQA